jgi:hypothetical protein
MSLPVRILRWIIAHPAISFGSLVAVILVLAVVQPCGSGEEPPAELPKPTLSPSNPDLPGTPSLDNGSQEIPDQAISDPEEAAKRIKPVPDPHDYDPETKAQIERQLTERPAVQFLPLDENGVFADLTDILPDGRLLITVTYRTTEADGRQQWNAFLRRHQDSGQSYVVLYRSE